MPLNRQYRYGNVGMFIMEVATSTSQSWLPRAFGDDYSLNPGFRARLYDKRPPTHIIQRTASTSATAFNPV
jgi:hypothetical protein